MKWTAKAIAKALATDPASPHHFLTQFAVVPNVSWSFLAWEADLLVSSKAGFLTEVEIKISAGDWKADLKKDKWARHPSLMGDGKVAHLDWEKVKYFWYAAPHHLAVRWKEFGIPEEAGVYGMRLWPDGRISHEVLKPALRRPGTRRLNDEEMKALARLGAIRYWSKR